ncbi:MAG: hypothetical protein JRJ19_11945 [Deltaproteobacteria bacterium]|nr:hypothetical protein [Deltaproteobacteria bacterium]
MPNLAQQYDQEFFSEWGRTNSAYVSSAKTVIDVLFENFKPGRVIDLGCGCGVHSYFLRKKGVEVVCLDGVQPPEEHSFVSDIHIRDLTVRFDNIWGDFDLALCLDVGEHIPKDLSGIFLENITSFCDTLLLACAPPGQGGHHHVNEQPKRYWIKRLAEHRFGYNRKRTGILLETFKKNRTEFMWMNEHISVYERQNSG